MADGKVLSLVAPPRDTKDAMFVIDSLRDKVQAGGIVAFVVVGLDSEDVTYGWSSTTEHVSRLRMMGAIADVQRAFNNGDI